MKYIFIFSIFTVAPVALAAKCPNIAGNYKMDTSHGYDTTKVKQLGCSTVIFSQTVAVDEKKTVKTKSTYILDGKWRPDKSIDDQKPVQSSAKMTKVGVEIVQRSKDKEVKEQKITLSLDEDRNLLINKNIPEVWQRSRKK